MSFLAFHPPVIAHRGASGLAPENTLTALRKAREGGAAWVEVDVKISFDGVPHLMHDETLERTTSGHGLVADCHWNDLKELDAGSWFDRAYKDEKVPSLAQALALILDLGLLPNIELKPCPGRAKATTMVTLIEMAKVWPDKEMYPLISSMDEESLEIAAQLQPLWPRGLILREWRDDWRDLINKEQVSALSMGEDQLTEARVKGLVRAQVPVLAFTVNDPVRAKELLSWGVTAVYADNPRSLLDQI